MKEKRNAYNDFTGRRKKKERLWCKWEDNIKIDLIGTAWTDVDGFITSRTVINGRLQ
jgi:hypothetical protein